MAAALGLPAPADAKVSAPAVGAVVPDFSLKDIHRRPRSLDGFKDKKAFVVVFVDTECPVANLYVPTADRIAPEVRRQGGAVPGDQFQQPGLVRQRLGTRPGAERAVPGAQGLRPEGCGCLRCQAHARGVPARRQSGDPLPRPHRRPVRRRLPPRQADAAATSSRPSTSCWRASRSPRPGPKSSGCPIERSREAARPGSEVTYAKHVAPIIQKRCQECHRPGEIGPFSLLTYEDAREADQPDPRSGARRAHAPLARGPALWPVRQRPAPDARTSAIRSWRGSTRAPRRETTRTCRPR